MRTFTFKSKAFEGFVMIIYDDNCITIDASSSNLNDQQLSYLGQSVFKTAINPDNLLKVVEGSTQGAKITELIEVPTFQQFWDKYFKDRYKDNSSKKRSEALWNRLKDSKKCLAFQYINKYFGNIPAGVQVKLAETYLSQEIWEQ